MPAADANTELERLDELDAKVNGALRDASPPPTRPPRPPPTQTSGGIQPMIQADISDARRLDKSSHALAAKLAAEGEKLAQQSPRQALRGHAQGLDKAKLGKVDAIIGQKRKLDIEVQDLAAGRFPEELIGRLWNASMIGDDEEYWPFEGVYWSDEYSGYR